jgi:hypothetical protein
LIIKAGTNVECSKGHVCGVVNRDIDDDDQDIAMPARPARPAEAPFTMRVGATRPDGDTWICNACGEVVARVFSGRAEIRTRHGWIG